MELTYRYDHPLVGFILAELLILGGKVQPILREVIFRFCRGGRLSAAPTLI
jgi:hypothetical protein